MKDRINPCIYYVCAHETCQKGRKKVIFMIEKKERDYNYDETENN